MTLETKSATPKQWTFILSELLDLIAFTALYATFEVSNWVFLSIITLYVLRPLIKHRFGSFTLALGFIGLVFTAIQLSLQLQLHPIISIAHTLPLLHAFLHYQKEARTFMGWRLIVGFIELLLAASIAPEATITLLIFSFIVVSTVFISAKVLDDEFSGSFAGRALANRALPKNFIRKGIYQSVIILFGAMIIFPLLPRVNRGDWGGWSGKSVETGYTEEVNLNQFGDFIEGEGSSVAIRVYGNENFEANYRSLIPNGLLRSKVLSIFSGRVWSPLSSNLNPEVVYKTPAALDKSQRQTLVFVKESLRTPILPAPYSAKRVLVESYGFRTGAYFKKNSEWYYGRSVEGRYSYFVDIDADSESGVSLYYPQDPPLGVHLEIPREYEVSRVKVLAEKIFKNVKSPEAKLTSVQSYFMKNNYLPSVSSGATRQQIENDKMVAPLENFLFVSKKGHCEYFATATAVLLRMGGVPTRLISGFRTGRSPVGDVLTFRMGDAHAWIEAYIPNKGWIPIDPTPKILLEPTVGEFMRDAYDWFSAKWYQYILNYSETPMSLVQQAKTSAKVFKKILGGQESVKSLTNKDEVSLFGFVALFIAASLIISVLVIRILRLFRGRKRASVDGTFKLRSERKRFDRLVSKSKKLPESELKQYLPEFDDWMRIYQRLRFGKPLEDTLFNSYYLDLQIRNEALKNRVQASFKVARELEKAMRREKTKAA